MQVTHKHNMLSNIHFTYPTAKDQRCTNVLVLLMYNNTYKNDRNTLKWKWDGETALFMYCS